MSKGTPIHPVRIPNDIWFPAKAKAEDEGVNLSDIIREALRAYIQDEHTKEEAIERVLNVFADRPSGPDGYEILAALGVAFMPAPTKHGRT